MASLHTQLKNMTRSTNRALTELAKLRQSSKPKKTASSNKDGSSQTRLSSRKGKRYRKREGTTQPETQTKDPDWATVVKRGIRKEAEKHKNDGAEKTVQAHITTGPKTDAFQIKNRLLDLMSIYVRRPIYVRRHSGNYKRSS